MPLPSFVGGHLLPGESDSRARAHLWTSYEDQRLLAGMHRFGMDNWQIIANFVGNGRTKAQCSQRWFRGLDPSISKDHWSVEQDTKLIELVAYYGDKSWRRIASELGDRCDVQCRYRYKQLEKEPEFASRFELGLARAKSAPPPPPKVIAPRAKPFGHLIPQTRGVWLPPIAPQPCFMQGPRWTIPIASALAVPFEQAPIAETATMMTAQQPSEQACPFDVPDQVDVFSSGSFSGTFGISPANSFNTLKFEN
jgi:hypothetical protein